MVIDLRKIWFHHNHQEGRWSWWKSTSTINSRLNWHSNSDAVKRGSADSSPWESCDPSLCAAGCWDLWVSAVVCWTTMTTLSTISIYMWLMLQSSVQGNTWFLTSWMPLLLNHTIMTRIRRSVQRFLRQTLGLTLIIGNRSSLAGFIPYWNTKTELWNPGCTSSMTCF